MAVPPSPARSDQAVSIAQIYGKVFIPAKGEYFLALAKVRNHGGSPNNSEQMKCDLSKICNPSTLPLLRPPFSFQLRGRSFFNGLKHLQTCCVSSFIKGQVALKD